LSAECISESKLRSPLPGWHSVFVWFLLPLAAFLVFGQTLTHEFINFDDDNYVYGNPAVTQGLNSKSIIWAFTHRHASNWHPLTTLSHMMDCDLHGLEPGGHHLTNVLLHAVTADLLLLALWRLSGAFWPSAFVAALFCIHPLRVESVAWVAERKDVLSGMFFALTLWAYGRYARHKKPFPGTADGVSGINAFVPPNSGGYWLALFFFTLGLLSKPMLVTLPFVLLLLDYWPLNRFPPATAAFRLSPPKQLLWEKMPFFLLSTAFCLATVVAQDQLIVPASKLGLLPRISNAFVSYVAYIGQMLYPSGLAAIYPLPTKMWSFWTTGLCLAVLCLISVGVILLRAAKPYLLVGWLWYLGMLLPVIGLVQVGSQARADRYTYLPQLGLYIMIGWGVADLCRARRFRIITVSTAAVAILAVLSVQTYVQTGYWRDSVSLWKHALTSTPDNVFAYNNLAAALAAQGKLEEAIPAFEQALRIKSDSAETHNNLGFVLGKQGKWDEAIWHFGRALQLEPNYADAHANLGFALAQQRQWSAAIPHLEFVLRSKPETADAHNNLGVALGQLGRWTEAIAQFERATQLDPSYARARYNLDLALGQQKERN
jgi:protein O-mannosyl-transferase